MNLHIEEVTDSDKKIFKLSGEIDAYTAPDLKEKLLNVVSKENAVVYVDLERVSYMDSTGLGVFISALKTSKTKNSSFTLINLQPNVYRLFDITGLNEVIDIDNTIRGGTHE